jgi:hypothetical protein
VWIALVLSAIGALLCLVLAIRRPRAIALEVAEPGPDPVTWKTFIRSRGPEEPRVLVVLLVGAISGIVAAAVIGLVAGAVTAVAVAVAASRRRARWWLALGAPGFLALSALYVLARQAHSKPTAAFEWPAELSAIHQVGWLAVAFLVALVVVDWIWDRANRADPGGRVSRRSRSADAAAASADSVAVSVPAGDDERLA